MVRVTNLFPRLPFNWRTPRSYILFQFIISVHFAASCSVYCISNILNFGACQFLISFCVDFQQTMQSFSEEIEKIASINKPLSAIDRLKLKTMLNDLVQFHGDTQQLSVAIF